MNCLTLLDDNLHFNIEITFNNNGKNLIDIFDIKYVYSIGKSAYSSLIKMNIDNFNNSSYIRHPSYGGKADFNKKIDEIVLLWIENIIRKILKILKFKK